MNFVFFGIILRTCLAILILLGKDFQGLHPKIKTCLMPKCTSRLMRLTPHNTFIPTDCMWALPTHRIALLPLEHSLGEGGGGLGLIIATND